MRFGRHHGEAAPALGQLEIAVLQHLWAASDSVDARSVLAGLVERDITLSTVQATLERLHRKGLLERTKVSRAYRYRAAVSQPHLLGALIRDLTVRLAEGELEPVISGFVELVGNASPELLDQLATQTAKLRRKERK
jgi:predicted transcriptional regulator